MGLGFRGQETSRAYGRNGRRVFRIWAFGSSQCLGIKALSFLVAPVEVGEFWCSGSRDAGRRVPGCLGAGTRRNDLGSEGSGFSGVEVWDLGS